jgi:4-amino-4-deoxychorismate lyase
MLLETIRCVEGTAQNLPYHQQRLERSLQELGFTHRFDLESLVSPPRTGIYRCRFVYDDAAYAVEYIPYLPKSIASLRLVYEDTIEYPLKYTDRTLLNRLFERREGCEDVLIVKDGLLTDTTIANIALFIEGRWLTPNTPLLEGTTRSRLIERRFLTPSLLRPDHIAKATKIAVMNAMMGFVEVENGIIG